MIVFICALLVMVIYLIAVRVDFGYLIIDDFIESLIYGVIGALAGGIIFLFGSSILTSNMTDANSIKTLDTSTELISLNDNFGIEGSAFLFSSCIDNELKYTYLYKTDKGLTVETIDAKETYIQYIKENEVPRLEKWSVSHSNKLLNWLFFPGDDYYILYIPKDSIVENYFNIDLK